MSWRASPGTWRISSELREKYRDSEFIQANGVKFFMDGGLYGTPLPFPEPSTLPITGILGEFKQPIFHAGEDGTLTLAGYVDLGGETCVNVRADFAAYQDAGSRRPFRRRTRLSPGPVRENRRPTGSQRGLCERVYQADD